MWQTVLMTALVLLASAAVLQGGITAFSYLRRSLLSSEVRKNSASLFELSREQGRIVQRLRFRRSDDPFYLQCRRIASREYDGRHFAVRLELARGTMDAQVS